MKVIQNVSEEGITYLDEDGQSKFINFNECLENYLKRNKDSGLRYVGRRNILKNRVEFFTEPMTRFEFNSEQEYDELIESLRKLRLRTLDMT